MCPPRQNTDHARIVDGRSLFIWRDQRTDANDHTRGAAGRNDAFCRKGAAICRLDCIVCVVATVKSVVSYCLFPGCGPVHTIGGSSPRNCGPVTLQCRSPAENCGVSTKGEEPCNASTSASTCPSPRLR